MGWFSRNINKIRAVLSVVTFIAPGAGLFLLAVAEGMNGMGWKFDDVELSPSDAAILNPWSDRFSNFYEKLIKLVGNANDATGLNAVKSYCCTMVNQYAYDDQGLSKDGVVARDNFIYKTFEALNAGINIRAGQLNIGPSRYWAEVNTANFNDPIYKGQLINELIECEHYGVAGMQPTYITPTVPAISTIRPNRIDTLETAPNVFDQVFEQSAAACKVKPCAPEPIKPTHSPTHTTPLLPDDANDYEAVDDAEILKDESFIKRYKWPIALLVAGIAAKQIFSNNN